MGKGVFLNVSAPGHVIPTLGLVAELVRRGEEIAYFEVPPFQAEIEAFGATFHAYPPIRPYPGPGGANQYYLAPVSAWCALEWVPQLLERVRAERALREALAEAGGVRGLAPALPPTVLSAGERGRGRVAVFVVEDTGEGIAPEDLPFVFDRFYRGEKSRSRATGGAGLGLAIARGIVEAHGGRIWIEPNTPQGTRVIFALPQG